MKSSFTHKLELSPEPCLKLKAENSSDKALLTHLFGGVKKMGDVDFATEETKNKQIKEVLLYKIKK